MVLRMDPRNTRNSDHADFEEIGDSIAPESRDAALTPEQRQELDRRIEDYKDNPSANISWGTIWSEALSRE